MKNYLPGDQSLQRGVAAIEFSLLMPVLMLLLAVTLYFGRVCWHYTVAQKAAHDAVLMLANATRGEITASKPDLSDIEIANMAGLIAADEIAELNPGEAGPRVEVFCDGSACKGLSVPAQTRVLITMKITDIFFGGLTDELSGVEGLVLIADVRMPYVGN